MSKSKITEGYNNNDDDCLLQVRPDPHEVYDLDDLGEEME